MNQFLTYNCDCHLVSWKESLRSRACPRSAASTLMDSLPCTPRVSTLHPESHALPTGCVGLQGGLSEVAPGTQALLPLRKETLGTDPAFHRRMNPCPPEHTAQHHPGFHLVSCALTTWLNHTANVDVKLAVNNGELVIEKYVTSKQLINNGNAASCYISQT